MDWFNTAITIGILLVTIVLAWAKFGTKIALIEQKFKHFEENHMSSLNAALDEIKKFMKDMGERVIRIEESLKKKE